MAERSKAAVLKTAVVRATVGSNPTSSADCKTVTKTLQTVMTLEFLFFGEMAELAEGARLLSECRVYSSTEGSNPSLSAMMRP